MRGVSAQDLFLVDGHRPASTRAGPAVAIERPPKCPPSFFQLNKISWGLENCFGIRAVAIQPVKTKHMNEAGRSTCAHPCTREICFLRLKCRDQYPGLSIIDGHERLPVALQGI